jgi:hypothetical protein
VPDWPAMRLSHATYIDHVRADGERLAAVAERGLDPPVPSCPGWTVRDVVGHTAEVFVSGDPLPMYLWIWGRGPSDSLTADGDVAAVDHLPARLVAATQ